MRNIVPFVVVPALLAFAPAARAEPRIAVVDPQRAWEECDEGKAALALLTKEKEDKQKQLDVKQAEFKTLQDDYAKQAAVLSPEAKAQKEGELEKRDAEIRQMFVQLQQELARREQETMGGAVDRVRGVIKDVADKESFQVVLFRAAVAYAPDALDITNEVIRRYNAKFPYKGPAVAPAAAADPKAAKPKPAAKPAGTK